MKNRNWKFEPRMICGVWVLAAVLMRRLAAGINKRGGHYNHITLHDSGACYVHGSCVAGAGASSLKQSGSKLPYSIKSFEVFQLPRN